MRLKSLTLSGFKSFPKRTTIHFPKGISAIVGPNGCGKSNIIDAIRWVLGEQSARMLRARQMSDVIFRGDGKKAVSSAHVKLVLENTGELSPPEFQDVAEIEIERTLFPNGDTKYRLNRKNCRLKEIRYLFMDTGAGTRAYSIIDQGQVNEFVEMLPEERRFMVEEVAGISRYKARRTEARRQMEETRQNLERLEDILVEVERQMRSLKRQAAKARRFTELGQRATRLEKGLLLKEMSELMERLSALVDKRRMLLEEIDNAQAKVSAAEAKRQKAKLELQAANDALMEVRAAFGQAKERAASLEARMERLRLLASETRTRLEALERSRQETRERIGQLEGRQRETARQMRGLEERLESLQADLARHEEEISQTGEDLSALDRRIEAIKDDMMDAVSARARAEGELERLEQRMEQLQERIERHEASQTVLKEELMTMDSRRKKAESELARLRGQREGLAALISAEQEALEALEAEAESLSKALAREQSELKGMEAEHKALSALERQGAGLSRGEKAILDSKEGSGLTPLAAHLSVEEGWEDAIEAALGALARSLVVPDSGRAARLATLVRSKADASASLIAADLVPEQLEPDKEGVAGRALSALDERGEDGWAKNVLSSKVEPLDLAGRAAKAFLSRVVTVNDLDQALTILRDLRAEGLGPDAIPYLLTRDLTLVSPYGQILVTAGLEPASSGRGQGLVYRHGRLRRLQKLMAERDKRIEELQGRLGKIRREIDTRRHAIGSKRQELAGIDAQLSRITGQIETMDRERHKAESRLEILEFEIHEAREELVISRQRLSELEGVRDQAMRQEEILRERLEGLESERRELAKALEAVRTRLQRLATEKAGIESSLAQQRNQRQALAEDIRQLRTRLEKLNEEMEGLQRRQEKMALEKQELAEAIEVAAQEVHRLGAEVARRREMVEEAQEGLRGMETEAREAAHDLALLRQQAQAVEGQADEVDRALSGMRREFGSRFGLEELERYEDEEGQPAQELLDGMEPEEARQELSVLRAKMEKMGNVNLAAIEEFERLKSRHDYLVSQKDDLTGSLNDIEEAIDRIDRECTEKFHHALKEINQSLERIFPLLFEGGSARLSLTGEGDIWQTGVEYEVRLPGKRIQHLGLLSGGEKALAALALIFAIYFIKPSPFCLLDEVDAPLDEANTMRFNRLVKQIAAKSQVVLVTHNQRVMEIADTLYGVTMEEKGVSKLVSVNLVEAAEVSGANATA